MHHRGSASLVRVQVSPLILTRTCSSLIVHPRSTPTNIVYPDYPYVFNNARPGYHSTWGFFPGAQNDIFLPPVVAIASSVVATLPATSIVSSVISSCVFLPLFTPSLIANFLPLLRATWAAAPLKSAVLNRPSLTSSATAAVAQVAQSTSCGTKKARRTIALNSSANDSEVLDSVFEAQDWSVAEVHRFSEWLKNESR